MTNNDDNKYTRSLLILSIITLITTVFIILLAFRFATNDDIFHIMLLVAFALGVVFVILLARVFRF